MQSKKKAQYSLHLSYGVSCDVPEPMHWCVRNALGETLEAGKLENCCLTSRIGVLGRFCMSISRRGAGEEGPRFKQVQMDKR